MQASRALLGIYQEKLRAPPIYWLYRGRYTNHNSVRIEVKLVVTCAILQAQMCGLWWAWQIMLQSDWCTWFSAHSTSLVIVAPPPVQSFICIPYSQKYWQEFNFGELAIFEINRQIKILPKLKFNPFSVMNKVSRFAKLKSKHLQGAIRQIYLPPIFPAIQY